MQVRLIREGDAGSNGGMPGNLYIELRVEPHEIFQRKDHDILLELPINFVQAALGDELEVPTLSGPETVRIPAGTQSGTVFRIKGKGVPYSANGKRGDHLVVVSVVTPRSLDERQRQLFKELADTMSNGFKTLDELDLTGKRVLLRADLNVPVADGKVTDATRIERLVPTIREIVKKDGKVILLSHFGRPKGKVVLDMSLRIVLPALEAALDEEVAAAFIFKGAELGHACPDYGYRPSQLAFSNRWPGGRCHGRILRGA